MKKWKKVILAVGVVVVFGTAGCTAQMERSKKSFLAVIFGGGLDRTVTVYELQRKCN